MQITPIAHFRSPLTSKFGAPRQSGLAPHLAGQIVFEPAYRSAEALRGLEGFDYIWLIWQFSANSHAPAALTVRPPRLGGNQRVGVFASRSPFRPNALGLSCVRLQQVETSTPQGPVIHVLGADLIDGTPIYDIKPYVTYADSHPHARSGFVEQNEWQQLAVSLPVHLADLFTPLEQQALKDILAQDPRPSFHHDPDRIYGMPFAGRDVRFRVSDGQLTVVEIV